MRTLPQDPSPQSGIEIALFGRRDPSLLLNRRCCYRCCYYFAIRVLLIPLLATPSCFTQSRYSFPHRHHLVSTFIPLCEEGGENHIFYASLPQRRIHYNSRYRCKGIFTPRSLYSTTSFRRWMEDRHWSSIHKTICHDHRVTSSLIETTL